jgi:hypothetical protein
MGFSQSRSRRHHLHPRKSSVPQEVLATMLWQPEPVLPHEANEEATMTRLHEQAWGRLAARPSGPTCCRWIAQPPSHRDTETVRHLPCAPNLNNLDRVNLRSHRVTETLLMRHLPCAPNLKNLDCVTLRRHRVTETLRHLPCCLCELQAQAEGAPRTEVSTKQAQSRSVPTDPLAPGVRKRSLAIYQAENATPTP